MTTRIAALLITSVLLSRVVPAAAQELNSQLMENERMWDGRPKVEPTSPQIVCQRPAPPPTLPAMLDFEQLEAAQPQLEAHRSHFLSDGTPAQGVYVAHDSMGSPRYVGSGT